VANCLMQLRKVCNHPDLFEVRPIRTSFVQERSIAGDAEPKYSRIQRLLPTVLHHYRAGPRCALFPDLISGEDSNALAGIRTRQLDASALLPSLQLSDAQPRMDVRTPAGWEAYRQYSELAASASRWDQIRYLNKLRCNSAPVFGHSLRMQIRTMFGPPQLTATLTGRNDRLVHTTQSRLQKMRPYLDRFANATPAVVAKDMPSFVLPSSVGALSGIRKIEFDSLHPAAVKLQIAFPDRSLLQHDCGKLQLLSQLLKDLKTGGHRVLIFTQMTRMLDILEIFLSHNGHRYSRLDGSTKVEDRLLVTERFNASPKIFALIASTRSGGVGIK
jgi:helicase SWR1